MTTDFGRAERAAGGRRPLRIVVDARLPDARGGGVPSVLIGLAHGLSRLTDGDEDYVFLTLEGEDSWLRPSLSGPCRAIPQRARSDLGRRATRFRGRLASAAPAARSLWHRRPAAFARVPSVPLSDGTIEALGADVVHFVSQRAFLTAVPSIYHPHDLQHLHLPRFFSPSVRATRSRQYKAFSDQAAMVAVASMWTKTDVARRLEIPADKIVVIPWAPPLAAIAEPTTRQTEVVSARLGLPARFLLYPARTWPHKNHQVLLEAAALLRQRNRIDVALVFTGHPTPEAGGLAVRARRLGVEDLVTWTGFLNPTDLRVVYARTDGVIIPSLFEAASAPLWEAWVAGKAAACSNVTSLPEQAGDAAIVFDPMSVEDVADAMARLWTSADLQATLAERGARRVGAFTWDRTARTFRAHYRRIGGVTTPSGDDAGLLVASAGI